MFDGERTIHCNNFYCPNSITLPLAAPDEPYWKDGRFITYVREQVIEHGWLIDLHSSDHSLLFGQVASRNELTLEEIERTLGDTRYRFEQDQHYCCLECAVVEAVP